MKIFRSTLTRTILIGILFLIILLGAGAASIGYIEFNVIMKQQYRENTYMIANALSTFVDGDSLLSYLETENRDENYEYVKGIFENTVEITESAVLYVAILDTDNGSRTYIYDVVGSTSGFYPYEIGYTDEAEEDFIEGYVQLTNGVSDSYNFTGDSDIIGEFSTTIYPIKNSSGNVIAVCGVVKSMNDFIAARRQYLGQLLIWVIAIAIIAGAIAYFELRRKIVMPIRKIVSETERFSVDTDKREVPLAKDVNVKNEIGYLAGAVDNMETSITENIRKLIDVTAENNRIESELNIASSIQMGSLPQLSESFPGRKEADISAYIKPAKEVGGDFYDCFFVDDEHLALIIADVSGKGIPAALFMMKTKEVLRAFTKEYMDPAKALEVANEKLCENNDANMFATAWVGIINVTNGKVAAANAGHEYPIIGRSGDFELYKDKHGFVLGGMEGCSYKGYEITLKENDALFLYTDGLPEAINADGTQFGTAGMLNLLNSQGNVSSDDMTAGMLSAIEDHALDEEQFDDMTMLCIRYLGTSGNIDDEKLLLDLNMESRPENVDIISDSISKKLQEKVSEATINKLLIATDEIFSNIVKYAYTPEIGNINVKMELDESCVKLTFKDQGREFNPLEIPDPDTMAMADEREIGGLGIFITKKIMDDIEYECADGSNTLVLTKNI